MKTPRYILEYANAKKAEVKQLQRTYNSLYGSNNNLTQQTQRRTQRIDKAINMVQKGYITTEEAIRAILEA